MSVVEPSEVLALLLLQLDWGADEALLDDPVDRFAAASVLPSGSLAQPSEARPVQAPPPLPSGRVPRLVPMAPGPALAGQAAAGAMDIAALHAVMDGFTACALRATASTTVAPSGRAESGLVMVYETPGPDDDRAGRAFSGAAGERLDRILASAGLDRTMLLLAPLIPWRPPGGRPVSEAELAMCLPFLHRLLALTRPARLVLLGNGPYRALGGSDAFRKVRGRWAPVALQGRDEPVPALVMAAPDLWLGNAAGREATWTDLLTLATTIRPETGQ